MAENLFTQLAKAQAEFEQPKRTKEVRGAYTFQYAPLDEVLAAVRPALGKYGLFLTQDIVTHEERECVRTRVYHGEQFLENHWPMIVTERGAQKHAGGGTFARRYGICSLLGLAPEDDDDNNAAEGNPVTIHDRKPAANGNGAKPRTGPLPKAPPAPTPHDPQTGEVGPRAIPVRLAGSRPDWIGWGGQFVAMLGAAKTREEGEAWITANADALKTAEGDVPKIYDRIAANIKTMRAKFGELPADFMAAQ